MKLKTFNEKIYIQVKRIEDIGPGTDKSIWKITLFDGTEIISKEKLEISENIVFKKEYDIDDLRKGLGIDDWLELVKEDKNLHGAYVSFAQYIDVIERQYKQLKNNWTKLKKSIEDEIYKIEPKGTRIIYNCEYDSEEDYIRAMEEQSRLLTLKENLSKTQELEGNNEYNIQM